MKTSYNFIDPDNFCVKISERILKNIIVLDNKMDELLACESKPSSETINISETIEQLIEYYENVALTLKNFSEKFSKIKR
jgi:sugar-specific transcriptional regulator TrmB